MHLSRRPNSAGPRVGSWIVYYNTCSLEQELIEPAKPAREHVTSAYRKHGGRMLKVVDLLPEFWTYKGT